MACRRRVFLLIAMVLWPAAAVASEPASASGEGALSAFDATDEAPVDENKTGRTVKIREEFGFGRRQNIDSFLGEYENPYAPPEAVYEGSRSEFADEISRNRI